LGASVVTQVFVTVVLQVLSEEVTQVFVAEVVLPLFIRTLLLFITVVSVVTQLLVAVPVDVLPVFVSSA
jgi:hypothetical protein